MNKIDVYSTADLEALTEGMRKEALSFSDYFANQMIAMHPRIVETLRSEGVDTNGRMPWNQSSASKQADRITSIGKRAAESLAAVAIQMTALKLSWHKNLVVPIEVARRERSKSNAQKMNV